MRSRTLIISILFLTSSCAYIEYTGQWPPPENIPPNELIYLEPDRELFYEGQEIKGIFKNTLSDTIYVVHPNGGGDSPLQKRSGNKWETLYIKREGVGFTQSVVYVPLPRYKTRTLLFPEDRLKEMDIEIEGVYRFLFTITYNDEHGRKSEQVVSRPFIVE